MMRRHRLTAFLVLLLTARAQALDFTYTNTNGTITITGYTGIDKKLLFARRMY
jgi:hypothetical protein